MGRGLPHERGKQCWEQSPSTGGVQGPALEEVDQPDDSRAGAVGAEHAGAGALSRRQAQVEEQNAGTGGKLYKDAVDILHKQ